MRLACLCLIAVSCFGLPVEQLDVKIPMRDGVRLSANVWRPAVMGRWPAVLQRTPYKKSAELTAGLKLFLDRGYVVIVQDVRGRYASEGEFRQYSQEQHDGEDTLSWIAKQLWSDGKVATFGGSYAGIVQWRMALTQHPALVAMATSVSGGDEYFDRFYSRGGAFRLAHRLRWVGENFTPPERRLADFQKMTTYLPLWKADKMMTGQMIGFYQEAMAHPTYDAYWKALSTRASVDRVQAPVLIAGGLYDCFLEGDIGMWQALRALGRPARIIIGPWGHNLSAQMPEADFGLDAMPSLRRMEIDWFDAYVKQAAPPPAPNARYFVTGANEWRESPAWPPEGVDTTSLYLSSSLGANSLHGDGRLTSKPPKVDGVDRFAFDPWKAVPTLGGATCCNIRVFPWGPMDQRAVEGRKDVLVYTGEELKQSVNAIGPVRVALWVASSAPDTDFTGKLVDVYPDGRAIVITDGILRLRYRNGVDQITKYTPGDVERIEFGIGIASHQFRPGHRVRLEISSSNFPKFDRNSNTGKPVSKDKDLRAASQRVEHGLLHPSALLLPVLGRAAESRLVR